MNSASMPELAGCKSCHATSTHLNGRSEIRFGTADPRLNGAVYADGGELIQSLLREELVDRLVLTTVPILLGQGRRLWGTLTADQTWTLEAARHWEGGFVQTRYRRRSCGAALGPVPAD